MKNAANYSKLNFENGIVECPQCHKKMRINMQICGECGHSLSADEMSAVRSQLGISFWGWALKVLVAVTVISLLVSQLWSI